MGILFFILLPFFLFWLGFNPVDQFGIGGTLLVVLIFVNLYVTYRCIRTPHFDKQKKIYQIAFVWLIPVMGAVTVWAFSKPEPLLEPHGGSGGHTSSGDSIMGTQYYSGSGSGGCDSGGSGSD